MFQNLTGLEYLKAEIACKHDKAFEKATWDERLAHFKGLDFTDKRTFKKASNPIGLRAAHNAYVKTMNQEATGYMISLDACSSGLQILSLLVSCPTSYALCGGVSDQCVDSYVTIYDTMGLHGVLTRKQVKQAIMTSLYGSTATPEMTFGNNVSLFYETMETMAPGAWDLNIGLQELWDDVQDHDYAWILPDNFHAYIETKDVELIPFNLLGEKYALRKRINGRPEFHKGLGPNLIHSIDGFVVREMLRRCMFDGNVTTRIAQIISESFVYKHPNKNAHKTVEAIWNEYKRTGFLSVRILDYIDSDNITLVDEMKIAELIVSLPDKAFELVTVHDCFRCHPNYGNDLRLQYNRIMADINDSTMLEAMVSDVSFKRKIKKRSTINRQVILNANYMLA